ncbi:MAG: primosomal protein [Euryarchaeota archaeon]|nr:primosomal protein [Euryarchaeota archaeon]|tara:strand:- start:6075 stop:6680 length:606 start_codon:yes stop_codon:yes gene_type:complete
MSDIRLITSWQPFEYDSKMVAESRLENAGKIMMKGILQKANTLNQNGRIYPLPILEREVRNYQKFIEEKRALGECDHPESSVVELKNASHIIREAYMEGDVCWGTVELLDTPSGKILQSLVESGVTLGISSRGVGSTRREGDYQVVQDDFQLICWDFVSEPSTPGAFMMREGVEVRRSELNKLFTKSDRLFRIYNEITEWK